MAADDASGAGVDEEIGGGASLLELRRTLIQTKAATKQASARSVVRIRRVRARVLKLKAMRCFAAAGVCFKTIRRAAAISFPLQSLHKRLPRKFVASFQGGAYECRCGGTREAFSVITLWFICARAKSFLLTATIFDWR